MYININIHIIYIYVYIYIYIYTYTQREREYFEGQNIYYMSRGTLRVWRDRVGM